MWPLVTCISSMHWTPRLPSLVFFLYTVIAYSCSCTIPLTSKLNNLSRETESGNFCYSHKMYHNWLYGPMSGLRLVILTMCTKPWSTNPPWTSSSPQETHSQMPMQTQVSLRTRTMLMPQRQQNHPFPLPTTKPSSWAPSPTLQDGINGRHPQWSRQKPFTCRKPGNPHHLVTEHKPVLYLLAWPHLQHGAHETRYQYCCHTRTSNFKLWNNHSLKRLDPCISHNP